MPRRKKPQIIVNDGPEGKQGKSFEPTSSLNEYFMCECGRKYSRRETIIQHIKTCEGVVKPVICHWCNLQFKSRGNLVNHAYHMHGDTSIKKIITEEEKSKFEFKCDVCDAKFQERYKLKFHIRRYHFNLWASIPHAAVKKVNQVWFEKVLNTNLVMQIKKTGLNTLVMKPIPPDAGVKVHERNKTVDLRDEYPIGRRQIDVKCKICFKLMRKYDMKKHMNETHSDFAKHKCNNCNLTFKRSYIYLQHVCHKTKARGKRKVAGVKQTIDSPIRITSVASLKPVEVD